MRRVAIAGAVLAGFVVLGLVAVRSSDGPLEAIPGGPLSGEPEGGSEPDWSFARDIETIELQVRSSPPRSVRTGILLRSGTLYVPVTLAPLKLWPRVVLRDPRVLIRIDGRLFERVAVPVTEPRLLQELIALGQSKYGAPYHARWAAGVTGYFRLDPP